MYYLELFGFTTTCSTLGAHFVATNSQECADVCMPTGNEVLVRIVIDHSRNNSNILVLMVNVEVVTISRIPLHTRKVGEVGPCI